MELVLIVCAYLVRILFLVFAYFHRLYAFNWEGIVNGHILSLLSLNLTEEQFAPDLANEISCWFQ